MSDNRYYVNQERLRPPAAEKQIPHQRTVRNDKFYGLKETYILYFPRSSSFRPSRYFRNSSLVTRSDMFAASFEVFSTISSTKIGQSTRRASASASEGRESMLIISPPRSSQMTA